MSVCERDAVKAVVLVFGATFLTMAFLFGLVGGIFALGYEDFIPAGLVVFAMVAVAYVVYDESHRMCKEKERTKALMNYRK